MKGKEARGDFQAEGMDCAKALRPRLAQAIRNDDVALGGGLQCFPSFQPNVFLVIA